MIESATIIIRRGRAYIPVNARVEDGGPFVNVEPVTVVDLNAIEIADALEAVASRGHPTIPSIPRDDWKLRKDPLLRAVGVSSWSKLASDSASYGIGWSSSGVTIYLHSLDKKGRFSFDQNRIHFLAGTPSMIDIAYVVIEDARKLPELGFVDVSAKS